MVGAVSCNRCAPCVLENNLALGGSWALHFQVNREVSRAPVCLKIIEIIGCGLAWIPQCRIPFLCVF